MASRPSVTTEIPTETRRFSRSSLPFGRYCGGDTRCGPGQPGKLLIKREFLLMTS